MKYYATLQAAHNALRLDTGFDPFLHGGVQGTSGCVWRKPSKRALADIGYPVDPAEARLEQARRDREREAMREQARRDRGQTFWFWDPSR